MCLNFPWQDYLVTALYQRHKDDVQLGRVTIKKNARKQKTCFPTKIQLQNT